MEESTKFHSQEQIATMRLVSEQKKYLKSNDAQTLCNF
jgi:hypothetical protein